MTRQAIHDGLKDQHRNAIIQVLAAHPRIQRAILFGSRAMGTYSSASDIDIALVGDALDATDLARLSGQMEELNVPQKVDLLLHRTIQSQELLEHIERHGVVVWERGTNNESAWLTMQTRQLSPMPATWEWRTLEQVCAEIVDCPHSTPKLTDSGPYIARSQDIRSGVFLWDQAGHVSEETYNERTRRRAPRHGDLLYSREGTYFGIAAEVPPGIRVCLGQRMVLLRPESTLAYFRFLRYWLNSPAMSDYLSGFRDGSVAERVNVSTIRRLPIPLPPLPEQRRIAAVLGALDDKIELNRRMNQTLEAMAQALFKSWFIDFDGHSDLVDSELGPIPRGWRVGRLGEEFRLTMGQSPPGDTYNEEGEGVPLFQGATDFGFRFPTNRVFCSAPTRMANPGDTLVSVRAPVGRANMATAECCIGRGVAAIRHNTGCSSYTYYLIKNLESRLDVFNSEGTVFGSINKDDFSKLPLVVCPADLLCRFGECAAPLDERIAVNERESRTLAALRDTLLPKLISGEIRVPDIEGLVEEAV